MEATSSGLMGILEKPRFINFVNFIMNWEDDKPDTHQGIDPKRHAMSQVFAKFGLQEGTVDFAGHAVALQTSDDYLNQACGPTIAKFKLYLDSVMQFGGSPFIYPIYGLGGLPEGFSRLSAIHQGVYMLNKPVDGFEYDAEGKVCGVRSGEEVARCKMVICDPSYVPDTKKRPVGRVIRAICIMSNPIPKTNNSLSCQIIIPQRQLGRRSDIYVSMVSYAHCVAAKGKYIAIVSCTQETPDPESEIRPALDLLGAADVMFFNNADLFLPVDDGSADGVYVTSSYDPSSHFESATNEVLAMWRGISGSDLDLTVVPDEDEG
jgi:Rab GDP dissociation inhibitor